MTEQEPLQRLYEDARAEGGELVVWAGGDAPEQADMYTESFSRQFPDIDINVTVDLSKYHDAAIDYQHIKGELEPDVAHLQTLQDFTYWKEHGLLMPYTPPGLGQVYPEHRDPEGYYYGLFVYSFSNVVDTNQVPEDEAPREMTDYLKPEFKDRIVLTYPHGDGAILYQFEQIIARGGWGWLDRLLAQNPKWVRGTATPLGVIGSGQAAVTFTSFYYLEPDPDSNFRFLLPEEDFFQAWFQTGAIFKAARHPAAAMNYRLREDGQRVMPQWPARMDVSPPKGWRPIHEYPNTSPAGFREFMHDRARVERLKGIMEQYIGPVEGPSPLEAPQ